MRADAGPNLLIASDPRHRGLLIEPATNRKRKLLFKVNVNPDITVQWLENHRNLLLSCFLITINIV